MLVFGLYHILYLLIFENSFLKVRQLGKILNVPNAFLKRHPFPGPGLAVRVLGDVTEGNALEVLRQVRQNFELFGDKTVAFPVCEKIFSLL